MEEESITYSVGQVSEITGVTVRTLRHYDEIGLLSASGRNQANYRRYGQEDLERLQLILLYRELGFPLERIAAVLRTSTGGTITHLREQHHLLSERVDRLQAMIRGIEKEMEAQKMDVQLTPEERFEVWGDFQPEEFEQEAEERWGESDAYKESRRRTGGYTKSDWIQIKEETESIDAGLVETMREGHPPDSAPAMALAEAHRQLISRWFYDCSTEFHVNLGDMYVSDPRFKANYDKKGEGLAEYLRHAIVANAARAEASR